MRTIIFGWRNRRARITVSVYAIAAIPPRREVADVLRGRRAAAASVGERLIRGVKVEAVCAVRMRRVVPELRYRHRNWAVG